MDTQEAVNRNSASQEKSFTRVITFVWFAQETIVVILDRLKQTAIINYVVLLYILTR